jgi:hypothetical protein
MTNILVAGGIGLFLGFSLGVFFMALVKVSEPAPTPEARRLEPVRQEQQAALADRKSSDDRRWPPHRSPSFPRTTGTAPRDRAPHSASHEPVALGTAASLPHPRASISATSHTAP